jgi:nitrogen regulatory protein PII
MKLVSAIMPTEELGSVRTSLRAFGFDQLTVTYVVQFTEDSPPEVYKSKQMIQHQQTRARLDIVADDIDAHDIMRVIAATVSGATTAWITRVDYCVSIRTDPT